MPGNHRNGTPVYKRIQNAIRKRIEAAELNPGDAVASERELAKTHKVSLMTARHALAGLEREGIVERRRGAGTFVAAPKIHFNKLMSYTEHMSSRGLAPHSRVLVAKVIEDEQEIAARLGLPSASRMVKIARLRLTGEEPARCLRPCNVTTTWNWHTPMRRSTLQPPTPLLPKCSACPRVLRFCASAR
jgi:GntR family transcriptional regulator